MTAEKSTPEKRFSQDSLKIFITGGTGFVGKHVVRSLSESGCDLLMLSRSEIATPANCQVVIGDLNDSDSYSRALEEFRPDAAIHLAWEGIPDFSDARSIKNLIQGLRLTLKLSELGCKKVLYTGSCWEYGHQSGRLSEKTPPQPFSAFTIAKNSLRAVMQHAMDEKGIDNVWARIFYVYGPGQRKKSLIPHLIESARSNTQPNITNPASKHDFIFVDDVAAAINLLTRVQVESGAYNIGSGKQTSLGEIRDIVFQEMHCTLPQASAPGSNLPSQDEFYANTSKLRQATGWRPVNNMRVGIRKTIAESQ